MMRGARRTALGALVAASVVLVPSCQLISGVSGLEVLARPLGTGCAEAWECDSGFCADGVCCDGSCAGPCVSCSVDGAEGTCSPYEAFTDPEDDCAPSGTCDGSGMCAGGSPTWAKAWGSDAREAPLAGIGVDTAGHVVLAGWSAGPLDFGCGEMPAAGDTDWLIVQLDSEGDCQWSHRYGDAALQRATGLAVRPDGTSFVVGQFQGTMNLGTGLPLHSDDIGAFLASFSASGEVLWVKQLGGTFGIDTVVDLPKVAVGTDAESGPVIAGRVQGTMDFGSEPVTSLSGEDVYVVGFDEDGDVRWQTIATGSGPRVNVDWPLVVDVRVAPQSGAVVLGGHFERPLTFPGTVLSPARLGWDSFVVRLTPTTGQVGWISQPAWSTFIMLSGIAIDADDNVVTAGLYMGAMDVGGGQPLPDTTADGANMYVVRYDSAGASSLARAYDAGVCDPDQTYTCTSLTGVAVDGSGNILLAGALGTYADFGGHPLSALGEADVLIAKLSSAGDLLYAKQWGDGANQVVTDTAIDAQGAWLMTGVFNGTLDFGLSQALVSSTVEIPESEQIDIFLAKFQP